MNKLKELLGYLKQAKFIEDFTDMKVTGGIKHRLANMGTNPNDKKTDLTPNDIASFKQGLIKFRDWLNEVIKGL